MFNLEQLIWPIDLGTFQRDYWEKRPLIVTRDQHDYYRRLLTLDDVDEILSVSSIHSPLIRVIHDGEVVPLDKLRGQGPFGHVGVLEGLYAELRRGATVALLSLHERWKPLKQLCQALASHFSAAMQVNVYLTPAHARGLKPHYDTHDVFVLQTFGVKHWRLFLSPYPLPLPGQTPTGERIEEDELYQEVDLHPGDMIYIPRGWRHVAFTSDSMSLHLTVGVFPIIWATLILQAVEAVIQRDVRFRESLPIGLSGNGYDKSMAAAHFSNLIDLLRDAMDPMRVMEHATEGAALGRPPSLDGQLLDLAKAPTVDLQTRLRRRPGVQWSLSVADGRASLRFHGKAVDVPAHLEPELRFIAESDECSASALPGNLDRDGRVLLMRRLLEEGFLTTRQARGVGRG